VIIIVSTDRCRVCFNWSDSLEAVQHLKVLNHARLLHPPPPAPPPPPPPPPPLPPYRHHHRCRRRRRPHRRH